MKREAVSPVIGVILMVAITVILAAVVVAWTNMAPGNAGVVIITKTPINSEYFSVLYLRDAGFGGDARVETKYWKNITVGKEYAVVFETAFLQDSYLIPDHEILPICNTTIGPDYCYEDSP